MDEKRHNITSNQLTTFIMSAQLGFGILFLPSTLAKTCGHDGWISVLLAGAAILLALIMTMLLLRRYKDKSIFDINLLLYGKYIGFLFNLGFIVYLVLMASLCFRLQIEIIQTSILKVTPPLAIELLLMMTTLYMTWLGFKVICRYTGILVISYIIIIFFFFYLYKSIRLTFVMPVGEAGVKAILQGMFKSTFSLLGIELIPVIYPLVTNKNKAFKSAVTACSFTVLFYLIIVFLLTAIIGEEKLKFLTLPLYTLLTSIRVPILDRLDMFFILLWFPLMGGVVRAYFFSTYYVVNKNIKVKNKKIIILILAILVSIISRVPEDLTDVLEDLDKISFAGLGLIGFCVISYLISFLNKRGVKR